MNPSHDMELDIDGLRCRDPKAVTAWYENHVDAIYALACSRLGADAAADVVQDTFLAALRKIRDFDPERGGMHGWLSFIARNAMRKPLRRAGREVPHYDARALHHGTAQSWPDLSRVQLPEEILERADTGALVRRALAALPEKYRRILVDHHGAGQSLREMAARDGVSESAMKSLLHRARVALKEVLQADTEPSVTHDASGGREV